MASKQLDVFQEKGGYFLVFIRNHAPWACRICTRIDMCLPFRRGLLSGFLCATIVKNFDNSHGADREDVRSSMIFGNLDIICSVVQSQNHLTGIRLSVTPATFRTTGGQAPPVWEDRHFDTRGIRERFAPTGLRESGAPAEW